MREYDTNMNDGYGECRDCDRLERQLDKERGLHQEEIQKLTAEIERLKGAGHLCGLRVNGLKETLANVSWLAKYNDDHDAMLYNMAEIESISRKAIKQLES